MSEKKLLTAIISRFVFLPLFFFAFECSRGNNYNSNANSSCPSSSCGDLKYIRYPFRLKSDPISCGHHNTSYFELDCHNNRTAFINLPGSRRYYLKEINYSNQTIRVADPGLNRGDLTSCPLYSSSFGDFRPFRQFTMTAEFDIALNAIFAYVHCMSPLNSTKYVKAPFCGNRSHIVAFGNPSDIHSYVTVREFWTMVSSDLEDSCTVDRVVSVSESGRMKKDNYSLADIYDSLAYGFELSYNSRFLLDSYGCQIRAGFRLAPPDYRRWWMYTGSYFYLDLCCQDSSMEGDVCDSVDKIEATCTAAMHVILTFVGVIVVRSVIGFPFYMWLVVNTWRKRHLSSDKNVEEFLLSQHNFAPIKYTYSEIKKMTNNFTEKLGEGTYGTVYKGKLRSGPFVAIKMLEQSTASQEEFISEVGTIGRIHHVNIVQLIGFCVDRSKYALVYEFLLNGSLDRYIFNQQSLDIHALSVQKMLDIALGVARGIDYLHHGCDVQILHFDIKPHNILLDENFNPKISDFGLARLHPTDESFIHLTAARGTMGYMAPEMFYKNFGGISNKADVYSFGMMLMEIAGRRKNMNPLVEDTNQVYFPSWAYDQLCAGNEINVEDATEEEKKMVKKIILVGLWCIQMRLSNRPPMNKIVEMLEGEVEQLQMPPKPFIAPHEMASGDRGITRTYSVDYIHMNLS